MTAQLELTLDFPAAVAALERTLVEGLDVEACPARSNVAVPAGSCC
ncbi:hypothetical protein ACFQ2M_36670 [Kitasatospora saccharophila]